VLQDEILNAPLIRRLNPTVLANTPIEVLAVKPRPGQSRNEMTEDDVPKQNPFYAMLDERAFRSAAEHNARGWKRRGIRELIDICARIEAQFKSPVGPQEFVESYFVALDEAAAAKAELAALQETVKGHLCRKDNLASRTSGGPDAHGDLQDKSDPRNDNLEGAFGHDTQFNPARGFGRGRRGPTRGSGLSHAEPVNPGASQMTALTNAGGGQNAVPLSYAAVLRQGLAGRGATPVSGVGHGRGISQNGGFAVPAMPPGRGGQRRPGFGRGSNRSRGC